MSLSYQRLRPVLVLDPVTQIEKIKDYAILRGGDKISWKAYTTNAVSNSSFQFTCVPPSGGVITSRDVMITVPIRLNITGLITTNNAAFAPPTSLINFGYDCPRAWAFASGVDTCRATINNDTVSVNVADVIHALLHYNIDNCLKTREYSMTPNYTDQSFNYADLHGSIRSPMASYGDGLDGITNQRGGFPFTIVPGTNLPVIPTIAGTLASATIDFLVCENVFALSPFFWGRHDNQGFYNVNSMDFNWTILSGSAFRHWSHDALTPVATSGTSSVFSNITAMTAQYNSFVPSFSYPISLPQMLFKYITPNVLTTDLGPNIPISYPYSEIARYPLDIGFISYASGPQIFNSNTLQLSQVPRRMYIYGRYSNNALYTRCDLTDTYLSIINISVQFANQSTVLSSASTQQLYKLNVANHADFTWPQWSGYGVNNAILPPSTFYKPYGTTGGPLCLEWGTQIQLDGSDCPGKRGNYQLQVTVTLQNMNSSGAADLIPMTLYIVIVQEGVFTITALGDATHQIGVVDTQDILNAQKNPAVSYRDVEDYNGGDFFSGFKNVLSGLNNVLQKSKLASNLATLVPVVGGPLSKSIANLGYGCNDGGVAVGGRRLPKSQLKKSLMYR
jgi:hypothetical protein